MTDTPSETRLRTMHPLLKFALELGPLVVFFIANGRGGIYVATGAFMVATFAALAVMWIVARKIAVMPLVSAGVVLVFGTLTIVLQDDHFIKMKPTMVNALFGLALLGGLWLRKPLLPYVLGDVFVLTDQGWRELTIRWGVFFLVMAVLNEVVWRTVSTDMWVAFKTFVYLPLTLVFAMAQVPLMTRHGVEPPADKPADR
ncbi:putative intracellular septation protein A [Starkeya nomas]|uniref:Inner membrane-spanning protein YciB n=2 Tax=Xanthobacteraceae TaxID=335928 RepID=A0A5S9PN46_9HYPH|nr:MULTISPECIES: septation protein A [Xanthobacteraceae]TSJ63803.1 septation protein A [Ancylobacter moscoviensis]CAA0105592.1 putative intracellular septation protein A [Starkeya nomas]